MCTVRLIVLLLTLIGHNMVFILTNTFYDLFRHIYMSPGSIMKQWNIGNNDKRRSKYEIKTNLNKEGSLFQQMFLSQIFDFFAFNHWVSKKLSCISRLSTPLQKSQIRKKRKKKKERNKKRLFVVSLSLSSLPFSNALLKT